MGKLEKIKSSNRRIPFYKELINSSVAKPTTRIRDRNRKEIQEVKIIDNKCTHKILVEAQKQLEDIEEEFGLSSLCKGFQTSHLFVGLPEEKNNGEVSEEKENTFPEEIELYKEFSPEDIEKQSFLVDLLKEKITEKRTEINTIFSDVESVREESAVPLSIIKNVAEVLSMYSSGKLPKAFKALPKLNNWEQLLYLTEPDNWTASAMFQATRLFASNLKSEMAQRFYNLILLPRIRDEIAQCQKLNPHLYRALKKALFKPRAFFKGIIIPLCESGTCTQREASILSSIISKCSIPAIHSNVALLFISRMDFSCARCIFMRVLLEKKCALYISVIDGVVDYFLKFTKEVDPLPVSWHLCFLTFVKNYKNTFSHDQQRELLNLLKVKYHPRISPEISKELLGTVQQKDLVNGTNE